MNSNNLPNNNDNNNPCNYPQNKNCWDPRTWTSSKGTDGQKTDNDNIVPKEARPVNNVCCSCQKLFAAWDCYQNPMVCGFTTETKICQQCYYRNRDL